MKGLPIMMGMLICAAASTAAKNDAVGEPAILSNISLSHTVAYLEVFPILSLNSSPCTSTCAYDRAQSLFCSVLPLHAFRGAVHRESLLEHPPGMPPTMRVVRNLLQV